MQSTPTNLFDNEAEGAAAEVAPSLQERIQQRQSDYNNLARNARLLALLLEKVEFKIAPEALSADKSELKRHFSPKTKIMSTGLDDGVCMANITWEVGFKLKNKNVVKCVASYIISYAGVRDCSSDAVTIFLENVGKVATYAYFRSLYSQLDWAATLGSDPLPVIQFLPNFKMSSDNAPPPPEAA